jgi:hypothetical protein
VYFQGSSEWLGGLGLHGQRLLHEEDWVALGLRCEFLERRIGPSLKVWLGYRLETEVFLKYRGAVRQWEFGDPYLVDLRPALQGDAVRHTGVAYPVDFPVGGYQEATMVVLDERDWGGVGSARLPALYREQVPGLGTDIEADHRP